MSKVLFTLLFIIVMSFSTGCGGVDEGVADAPETNTELPPEIEANEEEAARNANKR